MSQTISIQEPNRNFKNIHTDMNNGIRWESVMVRQKIQILQVCNRLSYYTLFLSNLILYLYDIVTVCNMVLYIFVSVAKVVFA